jgi:3-hydroxy-9,10-secoandrosta-1,3,5(10)-triene-9,17-dione monooxygenase reductase component
MKAGVGPALTSDVLVANSRTRRLLPWQRMRHAGHFTVNVLAARHGAFARRAAPPGADRFAEPDILREALAVIECDIEGEHAAGDHWIVVGRVRRLRVSCDPEPLVYFAGGAFRPHEQHPPAITRTNEAEQ